MWIWLPTLSQCWQGPCSAVCKYSGRWSSPPGRSMVIARQNNGNSLQHHRQVQRVSKKNTWHLLLLLIRGVGVFSRLTRMFFSLKTFREVWICVQLLRWLWIYGNMAILLAKLSKISQSPKSIKSIIHTHDPFSKLGVRDAVKIIGKI